MKTRLQSRREQSSLQVASPGANSPGRTSTSRQSAASIQTNDPGGSLELQEADGMGSNYTMSRRNATNRTIQPTKNNKSKKIIANKCNRRGCQTCKTFENQSRFYSTITRKVYDVINKKKSTIDCSTENVIYLLTCTQCNIQYVGETSQKTSCRMSSHRSRIKKFDDTKEDTQLVNHFTTGPCKDEKYNTSYWITGRKW